MEYFPNALIVGGARLKTWTDLFSGRQNPDRNLNLSPLIR